MSEQPFRMVEIPGMDGFAFVSPLGNGRVHVVKSDGRQAVIQVESVNGKYEYTVISHLYRCPDCGRVLAGRQTREGE